MTYLLVFVRTSRLSGMMACRVQCFHYLLEHYGSNHENLADYTCLGLPQTIVVRLTLLRHTTDRLTEEERLGDRG